MNKELKIMRMEQRIQLLLSRGETMNLRLINKLKRRIRNLRGE